MLNDPLSFEQFDKPTTEEWEALIAKDLKGKAIEEVGLAINDNLRLPPAIAVGAPISKGVLSSRGNFPLIIEQPGALTNESILQSLMGGANALYLAGDAIPDWKIELQEVDLSFLDISIAQSAAMTEGFLRFAMQKEIKLFGGGNIGLAIEEEIRLFRDYHPKIANWRFFCCPATADSNDPIQLVSNFLMAANERLEVLNKEGQMKAGSACFMALVDINTAYLSSIMMLRAMRLVWALLLESWGEDPKTYLYLQCQSDLSIVGMDDEEKNMIRSTSIAASALLGGADAIWLRPVSADDEKGDFYRRIARNNLHLFEQEGQMALVNDPAAGAAYFEHGTNVIAEKAWDQFRVSHPK